ncbi:hypothetical protein GJ496_012050 [Pomphorhynchus laevis]|nr:hypothetical protein GJ496_012050 [Pomphorhynchus laevis]
MIMLILDEERRGISEKLTNYVRFITNLNNELVGDIKDLAYKLVAQDHSMIEPLKPLLSHIVSTIHSLTKYIETADDQYTLHKTDDLMLASLSFQEQKQVLAKKKRKELAEARKAKVLAKMNKMKESFIKANKELYDQTVVQKDLSNIDESSCRASEAPETKKPRSGDIVLIGEDCSELQYPNRVITCILCQESRDVNQPGPLMGLLCFRQLSKFLNTDCSNDEQSGVYFSTCGHTMHYKCYQKLHDPSPRANWSNILVANYGYRSYLCLDASDQETLCPFCNTLCNIFVPFWSESTEMPVIESCDTDFGKWLESSLDACRAVNMDDQFRDSYSFLSPVGLFDTEDETLIKNFFDSCDASQHKVQPHLSWNQQIYHINSFIYTVRCNIAAIEADNQNIYSDISDQTLNLLEQLVILAIIHPGTNLKWSKHQNLRRYMEGICDGINSENDLLESLVSLSAVFANQPSASFIRCGFRHRVQSFVFKFVLARNYLNIRSMIESGELSMQLNNCTFSMISDPKESLMFEKNFYFLRLCAFFYRSIFRLQFSNRLKQAKMNTDQEYIALCEYLGLDNHFFDYKDLLSTVEQHICAPRTSKYTLLITNPIKLIDLPYDYLSLLSLAAKPVSSDMIMSKSLFDDDTEESRLTFLCLHCGDVLLSDIKIRQMRSGQMGCAVSHMLNCSGYCGIFIKIKDCMVVMLQLIKGSTPLKVRGAMASAPYVDQYGDTDDGLKRGYPLFLNQPLLQKLRQTWYRQNVPHESSRYAHTHRIAFSLYWENF